MPKRILETLPLHGPDFNTARKLFYYGRAMTLLRQNLSLLQINEVALTAKRVQNCTLLLYYGDFGLYYRRIGALQRTIWGFTTDDLRRYYEMALSHYGCARWKIWVSVQHDNT